MEFVYLVTQGDSLRERLLQQVRRIQDEVRGGQRSIAELDLLRLVSVAAAFEARLKVKDLVRFLDLAVPQRAFELLEKEYLLRRTDTGLLVEGLHPIRSSILANVLTDTTFSPWVESATACLPLMSDSDIGSFLLYSFSRHPDELEPLLQALHLFQPDNWIAIAGVTRALIWLGIKKYVEANRPLISEAYRFVTHGWAFVLNFDIANAMPGSAESFLSTLDPFLEDDRRQKIEDLRSRQTNRSQVFVPVASWLSQVQQTPRSPLLDTDWLGMAEVLFWMGHLEINRPVATWLAPVNLDEAVESLPIETLAEVALALFYGYPTGYQTWLDRNQAQLLARFRQATQTVVWEDDGQIARSHFALKLYQPDASPSETKTQGKLDAHHLVKEAMERLRLFRRLFPNRQRYACGGYGHRVSAYVELHDETEKNIPIENFPLQRLVSVNSTFKSIAEQDFRPTTWEEYAQQVLNLRQTVIRSLQQLQSALQVYFSEQVENNELRRYAITLSWAYIAIVPHVKGRSLNGTAWRFNSLLLAIEPSSNQLKWWNFIPVAIPSSTCSDLSLLTWSSPRLDLGNKLLASITELAFLAAHMKDFERLPELDELGQQQIQFYIQQLALPRSQILEVVLEIEESMASVFDELPQSQRSDRPDLIASMKQLVELHTLILPTTDVQPEGRIEACLDLPEIAKWAERLQEVQLRCFSLYLSWVSDVLAIDLAVLPLPL
ncbi:hypothetical protein H6F67_11500 [Microcoleus sp. FACHB-1515]|uniref:hypothetical protein n=1 Tax=Cyanophyceae TaxID=3028117 RepID=UPI00168279BD|nr:hypothetical protein [Microcoleus sp. FACHB-1515]MBD2090480.1 hypothetical protein [Microcoleus sp. FACHB-1515]